MVGTARSAGLCPLSTVVPCMQVAHQPLETPCPTPSHKRQRQLGRRDNLGSTTCVPMTPRSHNWVP